MIEVRAFIDEAFQRAYGTRNVMSFGDYLVVGGCTDRCAALGYRRAGEGALFLEHYLDQPIEVAVSRALGHSVQRRRIVEIGNLAANNIWSMLALWGGAANDLGGSSEAVVATLTGPLRRVFKRMGVPVHELTAADPRRLGSAAADWGTYYESDPWVCVGSIPDAQQALEAFLSRRRGSRVA